MNAGVIAGIVGSIIGVAGGLFGTYVSIRNTNGPREKSFMIRAAVAGWVAILAFIALLFVLPSPYRWFLWIPYAILLPASIILLNKRQQRIRREESDNRSF